MVRVKFAPLREKSAIGGGDGIFCAMHSIRCCTKQCKAGILFIHCVSLSVRASRWRGPVPAQLCLHTPLSRSFSLYLTKTQTYTQTMTWTEAARKAATRKMVRKQTCCV